MTPLEAMAKFAYDTWIRPVTEAEFPWEELPESHRSRLIETQRAALLALAEAELPASGVQAARDQRVSYDDDDSDGAYQAEFSAMLRSIATEGSGE